MALYHARDLAQFVAECDKTGGVGNPETQKFLADFELRYDTQVDQSLDPFSDEYFRAQVALYTEISGRDLDQETGELAPLDVDQHVAAINPYNSRDIKFLSKHTRAVLTCLMLADLPHGASILDAGCGWGLSTEAMAACGASVTGIDINPHFAELVQRRASRLGFPIEVVRSAFDKFETNRQFDLLFFYECLHHSLKPWETLSRLGRFVKPNGKILFAGEPINGNWWKHWGIRLDPASIYCIRKFGWWESGWSGDFIIGCFARAGFALTVYPHIGLDNGFIGAALRSETTHGGRFDLSVLDPIYHFATQLEEARKTIAEMKIAEMPPPPVPQRMKPMERFFKAFKRRPSPASVSS